MSATILDAFEYAISQGYTGTQAEFTELMSLALKYEKTTRKDLGRATAYGYAKSKGYTGTEEQFAELMASYATVAEEAADSASEAKGYAEDSQEWSVESEAWAVGQRNGASVDSEDPAYHNNSKYYKERAEELAEDAAISAATFTTDTSLTVAGKAADAKVTGNRLAGIAAAVGSPLVITDPDDFDNASHTRVYVYAGTTTSLYTNGDWYYWDGDGWENGGVYNSVAVDTDDTLSVSGMAADAAAVGEVAEEVTDLKSDLNVNLPNIIQPSGTNLFLSEWINDVPNSRFDGVEMSVKAVDLSSYTIPFAGEEATVYTLGFDAYTDGNQGTDGGGLVVLVGDNYSATSSKSVVIPNNTTSWTHFELTTRDYYTVSNFNFYVSSNSNNIWHIKNFQLNKGTTSNQYTYPYTAFDRIADSRLTVLDGYGLETYQEIESMSYDVNQYFKKTEWLPNTRILKTGVVNTSSSYVSSDFVFVKSGCKIEYSLYCENNNISIVSKWNLKKEFVSPEVYRTDSSISFTGTYTATEDCYIRFCNDHTLGAANVYYYQIPKLIPDRLDALENSLPNYWTTYLNGKKTDINSFISSVGNDGDYFVLFTDYHVKQNTGWTPRIINTLVRDYPIENAFNLGDIYNSEVSKELAIERLNSFEKEFNGINLYNCVGNHDINPYGVELSFSEYYNPLFKKIESYQNVVFGNGGYYYKDDPVHKIRYIVLNTRSNGFIDDDKTTQLPWFVDTLNNMQPGWYACIMMHIAFEWYGSDTKYMDLFSAGGTIKTIADAYQNRSSGTTSTVTYDFSNANGNIACILSGHTHAEHSVTSNSGYSIIAFDRDGMYYPPDGSGSSRTEGTVTEQAVYLVSINTVQKQVRCFGIGAGTNRTFSFD